MEKLQEGSPKSIPGLKAISFVLRIRRQWFGQTTIIDESIRGVVRNGNKTSETRNPNLQIYHGATQFVFEFGGKVLEDTTARVRKELKRFWRGQRHVSEPVFYYVVSAEALLNESVERVVKNVQFARGKYNALCALLGQPVEFGIIVTHLDTCEGWEFQTGLGENNVRLTLELSWEQTVAALRSNSVSMRFIFLT